MPGRPTSPDPRPSRPGSSSFCASTPASLAETSQLVGHQQTSPLHVLKARLATSRAPQLLPGQWTVDINLGATSQALGHRVALDWLSGHVPWWNPYEGLGTPLAAGMQSAAFFPPSLLLAFSGGQLVFRMLLEWVAGAATYCFLRRLGVHSSIATIAGGAYALNGTFGWYAHAEINPICLLPVCLLGVERLVEPEMTALDYLLLPAGVALSILAGFPEVAYLDAIFVGLFLLLRIGSNPMGDGPASPRAVSCPAFSGSDSLRRLLSPFSATCPRRSRHPGDPRLGLSPQGRPHHPRDAPTSSAQPPRPRRSSRRRSRTPLSQTDVGT